VDLYDPWVILSAIRNVVQFLVMRMRYRSAQIVRQLSEFQHNFAVVDGRDLIGSKANLTEVFDVYLHAAGNHPKHSPDGDCTLFGENLIVFSNI
jgi:hypothetical protein